MRTWLLVADGARGRLFKFDRKAKKLVEVRDFVNPEVRLEGKEFLKDAPGRGFNRKGLGRHGMQKSEHIKEDSKKAFAQEMAKYLDDQYKVEKINEIIIVAPSKLVGYLNNKFSKLSCGNVVRTITKELVSMHEDQIYKSLEKELFVNKIL